MSRFEVIFEPQVIMHDQMYRITSNGELANISSKRYGTKQYTVKATVELEILEEQMRQKHIIDEHFDAVKAVQLCRSYISESNSSY